MKQPDECLNCKVQPGDSIGCRDCGIYPKRLAWWYEMFPEDREED